MLNTNQKGVPDHSINLIPFLLISFYPIMKHFNFDIYVIINAVNFF